MLPSGSLGLPDGESAPERSGLAEHGELPWRPGPISKRPALVVVLIVAVVSIGGFALAATTGRPGRSVGAGPTSAPKGGGLRAVAATAALRAIVQGGEPPRDVLAALVVPSGSVVTAHSTSTVDLYDGSVTLAVPARVGAVVSFYRSELARLGWASGGTAPHGAGEELFATRPSSDGYYWQVGVIADPADGSFSGALAGSPSSGPASTVELRVFEVDDAD